MTYRTKNYTLSEEYIYRKSITESITIPKYSFILPMDTRWVPKHLKDERGNLAADETWAYTKYGFIVIPAALVRLAE